MLFSLTLFLRAFFAELQWLLIHLRIHFKMLVLTFRALHGQAFGVLQLDPQISTCTSALTLV